MLKRTVLVAGATGQQGGSVARTLLKDGHKVIGISRNENSPKAEALKQLGVDVLSADYSDHAGMVEIMSGVDTVFAMTTPFEGGMDAEIQQGKNLAKAAMFAEVGHFIFSSVGDADRATGIPHFDSKYEVEKYLQTCSMPHTIVGPAYFMDNLFFPFNIEALNEGTLKMAMPGDRVLQQIALEDIGRFVALVVNEREDWFGQRINISGDELSGDEATRILSKVLGREIKYVGFDPQIMREQSEDMALMYQWFIDEGYTADLGSLKSYGFLSFEQWAAKQDWLTVLQA